MSEAVVTAQSHEEWLAERKIGLGASDAAAYLGISKWKSNQTLWEEKVGLRQPVDISDKPYVQYGVGAEPHIRALFELDHPEYRVTYDGPYKIIRNQEHPFILCSPDAELEEVATGRRGGLEIKTTEIMNPGQWGDWKDRIPDQYYCQTIHQLLAADWEFVILVAQIKWHAKGGELRKDTREYYIERAEVLDDIEYTKAAAIKFWDQVKTKQRPSLILPSI